MTVYWRTGRTLGRTVYVGDRLVGLMDTSDLADHVVSSVNATTDVDGLTFTVTRKLLDSFLDTDDCWFDHHGNCQAHGFDLERGDKCPQAELKELLDDGTER